ncbi:MAG: dihydroorotase [Planctomycetes bacterium]|nr:dihydroorotase [Planctomycetota bacterium]
MKETASGVQNWLIRRVRLVDPTQDIDRTTDALVQKGQIQSITERSDADSNTITIDGEGLWLFPGLVEIHAHFREPGFTEKETLESGAHAAARGGYCCVVCEPNTVPALDSPGLIRELSVKAERDCPVRLYFKAAMTQGRQGLSVTDIPALARESSVVALSDDGDPVTRPDVMNEVARRAAKTGLVLSPHPEDSERALRDYEDGVDPGFESVEPYANETNYVRRDQQIAAKWKCPIHFSHISLARTIETITEFRAASKSARVSYELTPHHLVLAQEDYRNQEVPKVNPPLRSSQDRSCLQKALGESEVAAIACDHAPHTEEDKKQGACGLIGVETTLGVILTKFVHGGELSPMDAARLLSSGPARVFGLPGGTISPGQAADLTLIDPEQEWTVNPEEFVSRSRNTPFEGWKLRGKAVGTFVGGQLVYASDELRGRFSPVSGAE